MKSQWCICDLGLHLRGKCTSDGCYNHRQHFLAYSELRLHTVVAQCGHAAGKVHTDGRAEGKVVQSGCGLHVRGIHTPDECPNQRQRFPGTEASDCGCAMQVMWLVDRTLMEGLKVKG